MTSGSTLYSLTNGVAVDVGTIPLSGLNGTTVNKQIAVLVGLGTVNGSGAPLLAVIDISQPYVPGSQPPYTPASPYLPQPIGFLPLSANPTDVVLDANTMQAYVGTGSNVLVVDLTDPYNPVSGGQITGSFGTRLALDTNGIIIAAGNVPSATTTGSTVQTTTIPTTKCGDVRDNMIQEYQTYNVMDTVSGGQYVSPGTPFVPACSNFTQTSGSVDFPFDQLNTGDFPNWAILRNVLFAGLDTMQQACWDQLGPAPAPVCNFNFRITSGYRNPSDNASTPNSGQNSRHMFGDAADIATSGQAQWNILRPIAKSNAVNACVEPYSVQKNYAHIHVEWPDMNSLTDTFTCNSNGRTGW